VVVRAARQIAASAIHLGADVGDPKFSRVRVSADQTPSGLSSTGALMDTLDMNITKNIGMLLLAIYLIAVGILTLTGLGIGIITGVLALLAGIFILIGR
jgi:hypothetical protein